MKLKRDFLISNLGDESLLIATGKEAKRVHGMLRLNDAAEVIVRKFQKETSVSEVVDSLLAEYEIDRATAQQYVEDMLAKLRELGAIQE